MATLTHQQLKVRDLVNAPTLVIAGAGTGKTFTVCEKIAHIVTQYPHLHKVLAITFTNKAAKEMRQRLGAYTLNQRAISISTFHSFGLDLLRKFHKKLGYKSGFNLIDYQDKQSLLQELAPHLCPKTLSQILYQISWLKQLTRHDSLDLEQYGHSLELFPLYQRALLQSNCFDLDDLVYQSWKLSQDSDVQAAVKKIFSYWFIDEYQDTNVVQYHLFKNLCDGYRFTLVGDDDQSIYTWRGASPENLHRLKDDFCDLQVIKLTQNFRSTPQILQAANTLIEHNDHLFPKSLESVHDPGPGLTLLTSTNDETEIEDIVDRITLNDYESQAILVRTNYQLMGFEKSLRERGIAYQLLGAQSLFNKSELRDLLCYLRLLVNPDDQQAFKRVLNTPKRGLGPNTLEKIIDWSQSHHRSLYHTCLSLGFTHYLPPKIAASLDSVMTLLERYRTIAGQSEDLKWVAQLLEDIDYDNWLASCHPNKKTLEKKRKSLKDCLKWFSRLYEKTPDLEKVVRKIMILDMIDQQDLQKSHGLTLSTIHASKGLEFDCVYIAGVIEDIIPHHQSLENVQEERRLLYVGMTRARQKLFLSCPQSYQTKATVQSRFIEEIGHQAFNQKQSLMNFEELRQNLGY